ATIIQLSASLGKSDAPDSSIPLSTSPASICACCTSLIVANFVFGSSVTAFLFLTTLLSTLAWRSSIWCRAVANSKDCSWKPFLTFLKSWRCVAIV
ncbi:hypothetical protein LY76DRAFT_579644, partial [Colletotrichum caudatum]